MRGGGAWRPVLVWLVGVAGIVVVGIVGGMLVWSSGPSGNLELEGIAYGLGTLAVGGGVVVGGWIALLLATVRHYVSEERRRSVLTRSIGAVGLLVLALAVLWPALGQLDDSGDGFANTWAGPVVSVLVGLLVLAALLLPAVLLAAPGRREEVDPIGPASAPTWTPESRTRCSGRDRCRRDDRPRGRDRAAGAFVAEQRAPSDQPDGERA